MGRIGRLNYAQKNCVAKTGLLMQRMEMVSPGARIGIAVSGGVDSMTLTKVLTIRQAILPFPVELMALHVNPGFDPKAHESLKEWCIAQGLGIHIVQTDIGPKAFSQENRKNSPCFYCAMRRRTMLFELCKRYGLTHLAFGHNADDLAATFFMNMVHGGRVEGLSSAEDFFSGRLKVIRPLLLCDKALIQRAARAWNLPVTKNPCPAEDNTSRSRVMSWMKELWAQSPKGKTNMFAALERWQLDEDRKVS